MDQPPIEESYNRLLAVNAKLIDKTHGSLAGRLIMKDMWKSC